MKFSVFFLFRVADLIKDSPRLYEVSIRLATLSAVTTVKAMYIYCLDFQDARLILIAGPNYMSVTQLLILV